MQSDADFFVFLLMVWLADFNKQGIWKWVMVPKASSVRIIWLPWKIQPSKSCRRLKRESCIAKLRAKLDVLCCRWKVRADFGDDLWRRAHVLQSELEDLLFRSRRTCDLAVILCFSFCESFILPSSECYKIKGGWQQWSPVRIRGLFIPDGTQAFCFVFDCRQHLLCWIHSWSPWYVVYWDLHNLGRTC